VNILGFGISWMQMLLILLIAAVLVGPEKLPYYARKAAKVLRNIRKISSSITSELSKSIGLDEEDGGISGVKKDIDDIRKSLEKDVADLKSSFSEQSKAISQNIESSVKDTADTLRKSARDISDTISPQSGESAPQNAPASNSQDDDGASSASDFDAFSGASELAMRQVYDNSRKTSGPDKSTAIESPKDSPLSAHIVTPKDAIAAPPSSKDELLSQK